MVRAFILMVAALNVQASEKSTTYEIPQRIPDLDAMGKGPYTKWIMIPYTAKFTLKVCEKYQGKEKVDCLLTLHEMNYVGSIKFSEEI